MTRHIVFRILAGILLLVIIGAGFYFVYQAGVTRGAAINLAEDGDVSPWMMPFYFHSMDRHTPFMAPFGFLLCLGPLFLLFLGFLTFGAFRHLAWGRPMMHRPWAHAPWEEGDVPPTFSEWHRRAHEKENQPPAAE